MIQSIKVDTLTLYIFRVLLLVGIVWVIYMISNALTRKKRGSKPSGGVSVPVERPVSVKTDAPPEPLSLDAAYARERGLWVCARCETLNPPGQRRCQACGAERR